MIRIRGEMPQFKRCCMCLPLRHGLIVWGYIRLVVIVILFIDVTNAFFDLLNRAGNEINIVIFGFFEILGGTDIVLNVVFVYAGHTKNLKMLKAYYIYSFILWILMIIMGVMGVAYSVHVMKVLQMNFFDVCIVLVIVATYLSQIVIQGYILLLVRSQFIKLTTDCEFKFVNNAAESVCKMKCEEDNIANGDIIADGNITAERDVIANKDIKANTHAIADGNITANRNCIANGDKEVYK